jgi:leucyl-tRNA synthetase
MAEPFDSLFTQGMVIHETFRTRTGEWVLPAEAVAKDGGFVHAVTGEALEVGGIEKMSKSKKNVVDPDDIIARYGADTARWFMLSDTPPERDIEWTETGAEGAWRFTQRIWRLVNEAVVAEGADTTAALALRRAAHRALKAVTDDLMALRFNRAIARIYELANALTAAIAGQADGAAVKEAASMLVLMSAPMMPHLAEECWQVLGETGAVASTPWPKADPALTADDNVTIAVQVNGKRRDEITIAKGLAAGEVEVLVRGLESVVRALDGRTIKKVIVVPDRIANIVG